MRKESDGTYGYATGAKGYRWLESENMQALPDWKNYIDLRYCKGLTDVAIDSISHYGDFELFAKGEESILTDEEKIPDINTDPWTLPCKTIQYAYCSDCPEFESGKEGPECKRGYNISEQILGE